MSKSLEIERHHLWCNYPKGPAKDCKWCQKYYKTDPVDSLANNELDILTKKEIIGLTPEKLSDLELVLIHSYLEVFRLAERLMDSGIGGDEGFEPWDKACDDFGRFRETFNYDCPK